MNRAKALDDREFLLREARALREQRLIPQALTVLDRLRSAHPRFSRLHQERAQCMIALGDSVAAISALREAITDCP